MTVARRVDIAKVAKKVRITGSFAIGMVGVESAIDDARV